jgi:hypothetical protein
MFEVVRSRSTVDELAFICPVPGCGDQSGNRSVNLKTGKTNCWRCNVGGDFIKWAHWLGYAVDDDSTPMLSLEEFYKLLDPPKPVSIIPVISEIALPKGFHSCYDNPNSVYTRQIGEMAIRKNLTPEDLINAGAGYVSGDSSWQWYAVFPVLEYGRLVYYQGRTYWDEPGAVTKKFPSRQEAPLSSKYWIYDIDEIEKPGVDTIIVVESILNVLSLKTKLAKLGITNMVPICVFKHSVSKTQFLKLLRFKNIKEAILLFDFDAIDLSWKDAKRIDDLLRVSIAEMPFSSTNKKLDPNDDVDAAWEAIVNRTHYTMAGVAARAVTAASFRYYATDISKVLVDQQHPSRMSTTESCSSQDYDDTKTVQREDCCAPGERGDHREPHPAGKPSTQVRDRGGFSYR